MLHPRVWPNHNLNDIFILDIWISIFGIELKGKHLLGISDNNGHMKQECIVSAGPMVYSTVNPHQWANF